MSTSLLSPEQQEMVNTVKDYVSKGVVSSLEAARQVMADRGIEKMSSMILTAIDEIDKNTWLQSVSEGELQLILGLKEKDDFIALMNQKIGQLDPSSEKAILLKRSRDIFLQSWQEDYDKLGELAKKRNITSFHNVGDYLRKLFPSSPKVIEAFGKLTSSVGGQALALYELEQILESSSGEKSRLVEELSDKIITTWIGGQVNNTNYFKNLFAGTKVLSAGNFLKLVGKASVIQMFFTAEYYGIKKLAGMIFNKLGLYDDENYIAVSNLVCENLTGSNSFEKAEAIGAALCLFKVLDKNFDDYKANKLLGSEEIFHMDFSKTQIAYEYLCKVFDLDTGYAPRAGTPDNAFFTDFVKGVLTNQKTIAQTSGLQNKLDFDAILWSEKALAGDNTALAYRLAAVNLSPFAILSAADSGVTINYSKYTETLALYDAQTQTGRITEQYLKDRIAMINAVYGQNTSIDDYFDVSKNVENLSDISLEGQSENQRYDSINKIVFGGDGDETLIGEQRDDHLYGGDGNDSLEGGDGANYLEGGRGVDRYYVNNDGAADTILDVSVGAEAAQDQLYIDNALVAGAFAQSGAGSDYFSADKKYKLSKKEDGSLTLYVLSGNTYRSAAVLQNYTQGKYGISLQDSGTNTLWETSYAHTAPGGITANLDASLAPAGFTLIGNNKVGEFSGSVYGDVILTVGGTSNYVNPGYGDDLVIGAGNALEWIRGGLNNASTTRTDHDTVSGGVGSDIIYGGGGNDLLFADDFVGAFLSADAQKRILEVTGGYSFDVNGYKTQTSESAEFGDFVSGEIGDDIAVGSYKSDVVLGGAGSDKLYGGAGNDLLLGDATYTFSTSPSVVLDAIQYGPNIRKYKWDDAFGGLKAMPSSSYENTVTYPSANVYKWSWGVGADGDYVLTPYKTLLNQYRVAVNPGDDYLDGGAGDDWMAGQSGNDQLYGGEGDDILYGDDKIPLAEGIEGNDTLHAGSGKDRLDGGGGDDLLDATEDDHDKDILEGGAGDDVLRGGTGHDVLDGGEGDDALYAGSDGSVLNGGEGSDLLFGGEGDDTLEGGEGADWIVSGAGNDSVTGGAGADHYLYALSDLLDKAGVSTLEDASAEDRIYIGGARLDELSYTQVSENTWKSDNGLFELKLNAGSGLVIKAYQEGGSSVGAGSIFVKNFVNGVAGITLTDNKTNHAPTANALIGNQQGKQDLLLTYTLPDNLFADEDGDTLTYMVAQADGSPLPDWLSYNDETRTLSGTPSNDDVGHLSLRVTAADPEGLSASQVFDLRVENVNDAPTANGTIPNQSAKQGKAFSFVLPENAFSDPDIGDQLTYSAKLSNGKALPKGVSIDPLTGRLFGTPGTSGDFSIILTATDREGLTAEHRLTLSIGKPNRAPEPNGAAQNQLIRPGDAFSYTFWKYLFADADWDPMTYEVTLLGGAPLPSWLSYNDETRTLSGTPSTADIGEFALNITATDPDGAYGEQEFLIWVDDKISPYNEQLGSWYIDGIVGTSMDDHIRGFEGGDLIEAGAGNDWLEGGDDLDRLYGEAGDDILEGQGGNDLLYGGIGNDRLSGGTGIDYLYGEAGDDTLDGGAGNDNMNGGTGNDTYYFGRNDGQDNINNSSVSYQSETDILKFKENITADQLWFRRNGLKLEVSIIGTTDKVTLPQWFEGDKHHLDEFQLSSGEKLLESQVNTLVDAMAAFNPPSAGQTTLPQHYQDALQGIIAASWK